MCVKCCCNLVPTFMVRVIQNVTQSEIARCGCDDFRYSKFQPEFYLTISFVPMHLFDHRHIDGSLFFARHFPFRRFKRMCIGLKSVEWQWNRSWNKKKKTRKWEKKRHWEGERMSGKGTECEKTWRNKTKWQRIKWKEFMIYFF